MEGLAVTRVGDVLREARRGVPRRRWAILVAAVVVASSAVAVAWMAPGPQPGVAKIVRLSPDALILRASDIPDIGWGLRASGTNASGVWRLFAVHNELVLAFLNVTLWVEPDATAAATAFGGVASSVTAPAQDGQVTGADASWFWSSQPSWYAGMLVRRYNVVFVLSAYLESSWYLTRSDLATWSGWQLARVEAAAA